MTSDASPTARALLALEYIQNRPGVTAERLAQRLGVSDRAARRYVAIIREAGIPIESVRGPYGGYRIGRGLRLPPLMFSAAEALSLVMAVLDGHHDVADPQEPAGTALGKIIRALPEPVAAQAELVRRTASAAPDTGAARPDPAITATLVQACSERREVVLRYRSEAGVERDIEVQPWAVIVRHGRWYLLCHSVGAGQTRAYRVDRIGAITLRDTTFAPPNLPDPVAALHEHLAAGWEYDTEVVIDGPAERIAPTLPAVLGRVEPIDEQTCRLTGSTSNPWWYAEQLAAVQVPFRVVGGPELRHTVAAVGRRMLAAADPDQPPDPDAHRAGAWQDPPRH